MHSLLSKCAQHDLGCRRAIKHNSFNSFIPSSAPNRSKSPKKTQSDRVPKGSDDEIKKFHRFHCLDEDMEDDDEIASGKQQGKITRLTLKT